MADNILFLGTGAADWSLQCTEKPLRRFSSVLINEEFLIDPGPHLFHFEHSFGYDGLYTKVRNILLTHSHGDHFSASTLQQLSQHTEITLYADESVSVLVKHIPNLHFCPVSLWKPVQVGMYEVTAMSANHSTECAAETPCHYSIRTSNGKEVFYGCDGAWLLNRTWKALSEHCYDLMVLDGTIGDAVQGDNRIFAHNSLDMVRAMCAAFRQSGVVKKDAILCVSHLARTLHGAQEAVEAALAADGILAAHDNMCLEI